MRKKRDLLGKKAIVVTMLFLVTVIYAEDYVCSCYSEAEGLDIPISLIESNNIEVLGKEGAERRCEDYCCNVQNMNEWELVEGFLGDGIIVAAGECLKQGNVEKRIENNGNVTDSIAVSACVNYCCNVQKLEQWFLNQFVQEQPDKEVAKVDCPKENVTGNGTSPREDDFVIVYKVPTSDAAS